MSLEVRLTLGDPPHITVSGQTPAPGGALEGVEHGGDSKTNESVQAVLKPDEAAAFRLGIPRGRMEAQVTYRRQLTGGVFVHYRQKPGGHSSWFVPLAQLYASHTQREARRIDFYAHTRTTQRHPRPEGLTVQEPAQSP